MKENKHVHDCGNGKDRVMVVRYEGSQNIRKMIIDGKYIEAFVHTQLGIEKILWDKIVAVFEGEKAMIVRRTIEESKNKQRTKTSELIKWAHFLNAIDDNDFGDLKDFNDKRNSLMHSHGGWWNKKYYEMALNKGIEFLEKNNL